MHPLFVLITWGTAINMEEKTEKPNFYVKSQAIEPPAGLLEKILSRVHREQKITAIKRQLVIFSICLAVSLAAFIPAWRWTRQELAQSGFLELASLLFSDAEITLAYWQNFCLSLLETLPVMSLAILLATVLALLESLKMLAKNLKLFHLKTAKN